MKTALADDEQDYLDEMAGLVCDFGTQRHCHVETVPFLNAEGFFKAFGDGSFSAGGCFDAVLMDIYMVGVDAAQKIRCMDNRCVPVFLTSSPDFMPDAFSCYAFEYARRPVPEGIRKGD